jgi:hypothetical protein
MIAVTLYKRKAGALWKLSAAGGGGAPRVGAPRCGVVGARGRPGVRSVRPAVRDQLTSSLCRSSARRWR